MKKSLDSKRFACDFTGCRRDFKTKFSMKRHKLIHAENKQFACEYCEKKFALPQYLKEHIYTHSKDKPYVCGIGNCNKRFRQAGKLSLHRRTHEEYTLKRNTRKQTNKNLKPKEIEANENHESEENSKLPLPLHRDGEECDRRFARQDSGQTTATVNPRLHEEEVKEEDWVDVIPSEEPVEDPVDIKQDDKPQPTNTVTNPLSHYLNNLSSPLMMSLRLKLPLPFKPQPIAEIRVPDLFEWSTKRDNT